MFTPIVQDGRPQAVGGSAVPSPPYACPILRPVDCFAYIQPLQSIIQEDRLVPGEAVPTAAERFVGGTFSRPNLTSEPISEHHFPISTHTLFALSRREDQHSIVVLCRRALSSHAAQVSGSEAVAASLSHTPSLPSEGPEIHSDASVADHTLSMIVWRSYLLSRHWNCLLMSPSSFNWGQAMTQHLTILHRQRYVVVPVIRKQDPPRSDSSSYAARLFGVKRPLSAGPLGAD
ncbi:hypothetical protein BC834DRAFT_240558 [Gloeopeniophorella convolvens]|nr:hypothetical protein BC834DRAFT_240558 [Gloeopeniophorella convolvens]